MFFTIEDLSMFCADAEVDSINKPASTPLLMPTSVSGYIRLPKIVSQMIRTDPLETKYGHLVVNVKQLIVNGTLENLIAITDFSVMIDTYRKWYACVEKTLSDSFKSDGEVMFTYITAYLK